MDPQRGSKTGRQVGAVVCVKAKGRKEAWHLAASHGDKAASEIVALYGERLTIEESFRDPPPSTPPRRPERRRAGVPRPSRPS